MEIELLTWAGNLGVAFVVIAFMGLVGWRIMFGTKTKPGLLEKAASEWSAHILEEKQLTQRVKKHDVESRERDVQTSDALHILVQSNEPPIGTAYVAAQAVYKTALQVEQVQSGMLQSVKICRLLAKNFPDVEAEIDKHCDEIERILKQT